MDLNLNKEDVMKNFKKYLALIKLGVSALLTSSLLSIPTNIVFASSIADQLISEGEGVATQIVNFVSDGFSGIIAPIMTVLAIAFGIFKIIKAFILYRREGDIDVMGIVIAVIAIIVAGVLGSISIAAFVQ